MKRVCNVEYVLVIVCMFSGWVETYPCAKADSITVSKKLLRDVIPKFGIPLLINLDHGTHFTEQMMKDICKALNIYHHFHCPYHLQSAGMVERQNGILKNKLAKKIL